MSDDDKASILIVDDEMINREIIMEFLDDEACHFTEAENGLEAWQLLEANPGHYDIVLLDRMMPVMGGLELLSKMRDDLRFRFIPAILQTARAVNSDLQEGIDAGAMFYLSKPYDQSLLVSLSRVAIEDSRCYASLIRQLAAAEPLEVASGGEFAIRTFDEARALALRLADSVLGARVVTVSVVDDSDRRVTIQDQGDGFAWQGYLQMSPARGQDLNGRGIAITKSLCLPDIEYVAPGNRVTVTI